MYYVIGSGPAGISCAQALIVRCHLGVIALSVLFITIAIRISAS
jgi:hypothetical protein